MDAHVIRGILFDLDGTLADTEPLQWEAYRRALRPFGVEIGMDEYRRHWIAAGGGSEYAVATYRLPIDPPELRRRKTVEYHTLIAAGVSPRPGARAALERLRPDHRLAVATNSSRADVAIVMRSLRIADLLDATIVREDYVEAKPAPDAYRAAARALGLPPADCAVVEDTPRGVQAGVAAGCTVVALVTELGFDDDFTGAARRVTSLDEVGPALLRDLSAAR